MRSEVPPVQRLGDAVLIQGRALPTLTHLALLGARERARRGGVEPGGAVREWLQLLADASHARHDGVVADDESAESALLEPIGAKEAATMLGIGVRQAQRIARSIGGRRCPGGAWEFERGAVVAYIAGRDERRAA